MKAKINANEKRFNLSGKIDIKPSKNTFLSLGGSYYALESRDFSSWRSMFSSANNRQSTQHTYRVFGKLVQKFGSAEDNEDESSATIKNAFFTIQGNYTNNKYTYVDADHQEDLFNYGYVGQFVTSKAPVYNFGSAIDSSNGRIYTGRMLSGWTVTLFEYTPGGVNTSLENYTNAYIDMFSQYSISSYIGGYGADGVLRTAADLQGQGLLNGQLPSNVYSLFGNHGSMYNGSAKQENTQTTFKASGSADIKSHDFSFGFEF